MEAFIPEEQALEELMSRLKVTSEEAEDMLTKINRNEKNEINNQELKGNIETITHITESLMDKLQAMDTDNNGFISADEALDFIKTHMSDVPEKTCGHIVRKFDREDNGQVDYKSFVLFYAHISAKINSLKSQFDTLDVDGDGKLDADELTDRLVFTCGIKPWQAESLMYIFDDNRDGKISKKEFSRMVGSLFG